MTNEEFEFDKTAFGAKTIAYAKVNSKNRWTQNTKQIVNGKTLGPAVAMVIAQYQNDNGYYLFGVYPGGEGTDTYHSELEDALGQMDYEYENLSSSIVWMAKPTEYDNQQT